MMTATILAARRCWRIGFSYGGFDPLLSFFFWPASSYFLATSATASLRPSLSPAIVSRGLKRWRWRRPLDLLLTRSCGRRKQAAVDNRLLDAST
nr:hypothetical protein Itr_chr15CG15010 [Ipomoea trifida]